VLHSDKRGRSLCNAVS